MFYIFKQIRFMFQSPMNRLLMQRPQNQQFQSFLFWILQRLKRENRTNSNSFCLDEEFLYSIFLSSIFNIPSLYSLTFHKELQNHLGESVTLSVNDRCKRFTKLTKPWPSLNIRHGNHVQIRAGANDFL